jgi:diguanylate cyclase (GGDEF)-like protein/PAS domain S-box-containing protein
MKITVTPGLWLMTLLVFLLSAGASGSIWLFLRGQESRRAQAQLTRAAASLQDRVQAELDSEVSALRRLAAKWQIRPEMSRLEWDYDVRQLLEQHPSLLSVAWLEPSSSRNSLKINWSLPTVYEPAVLKLHGLIEENRPALLTSVLLDQSLRISEPIVVADRGKAFAVYVPGLVDGRLKGAVLGVFHLQVLLDFVFDRLLPTDYTVRLLDGYQQIYNRGLPKNSANDWEYSGTLEVFSSRWQLRMWPNPDLQRSNERLADMLLLGGLLISALLSLLVYYAAKRPGRKQVRRLAKAPETGLRPEDRLAAIEAVFSQLPYPIVIAEAEVVLGAGPVLRYANPAFCELTGYTNAELAGQSPRLLFASDTLTAGKLSGPSRLSVHCKSGAILERAIYPHPILDEEQQPRFWVISLELATTPAPAPTSALAALLAEAPLAAHDARGQLLFWNEHAETLTGFPAATVLGKATPLGVEHPPPGFLASAELTVRHQNGDPLRLLVLTAPLNSSGPERYLSFAVDVTKDRVQNEELDERLRAFRALAEQASDILAILDRNSTIQYINPAVEALLGISPASLAGGPVQNLVADVPPVATDPLQLRLRHHDGGFRTLESKLLPIEGTPLLLLSARPGDSSSSLLENLEEPVLTFDREQRLLSANEAALRLFGVSLESAGRSLAELLPDWLQFPSREQIAAALDQNGSWKGEISFYAPSGRELVVEASLALSPDGSRIVALYRDISSRRLAVEALTLDDAERSLNLIGSTEGLWDWNLLTDEVYFSPRWREMLGLREAELDPTPKAWFALIHPDDLPGVRHSIDSYLQAQQPHLEIEYRARLDSGDYRWMLARAVAVRSEQGEPRRLVGLQTDIHDQKQRDEVLLFEAFHDSLTGLENRALFLDRLEGLLLRGASPFTIAFLDMESFVSVNRALGARGGDRALAEIGRRLREAVPPGSHVARHGSDEFLVLLPSQTPEQLAALKLLWQSRLAAPFTWQGQEVSFQARVGFALSSDLEPGASAEALLQAATRDLTGSAPAAPPDLPSFPLSQFRVFYQPIVELASGEISGFEALLRWQHPEQGLLVPGQFLAAAEASGHILELDRWMLTEAAAWIQALNLRLPNSGPLSLTVNLSSRHFLSAVDTATLAALLRDSQLPPSSLRVELNDFPDPLPAAFLNNLRGLGVQCNLSGVSSESFAGLPLFAADRIKLSRTLVRGLSSGRHLDKVRSIIGMARRQNLQVVAEGVETLEQLAVLRDLQCHLAQGFYFTQPSTASDSERLLARSPRW